MIGDYTCKHKISRVYPNLVAAFWQILWENLELPVDILEFISEMNLVLSLEDFLPCEALVESVGLFQELAHCFSFTAVNLAICLRNWY